MFTRFQHFIESLQEADEARKKRWVIGASAVAMLIIILLWLMYLSLTLPVVDTGTTAEATSTDSVALEEAPPAPSSIFDTFGRGISIVVQNAEAGLAAFAGRMADNVHAITKRMNRSNVIEVKGE